jgi:hypothetical protein
MRSEGGRLVRDNMVPVPGSGWLALQECLARAIADAFIRQTRFDPRRAARSEQLLYDQLPALLERLDQAGESNIDIEGRQARVERSSLAEACETHYQRIVRTVSAGDARVFLGPTLRGLPGLRERLPGAVACEAQAVSEGVTRFREAVLADATGVHFITSLPAQTASAPAPEPAAAPAAAAPAAEARPERPQAGRCQIEIEGAVAQIRPLSGPAPALNGRSLDGPGTLADGDLIEFADGTAWRLVAVRNSGNDGSQT